MERERGTQREGEREKKSSFWREREVVKEKERREKSLITEREKTYQTHIE